MKMVVKSHPLVGKFFHSFRNGEICWQGQVRAVADPGFYLCQFFEWLAGGETHSEVITIKQMVENKFRFYDDQEWWRSEGNRLSRQASEKDQIKQ
jgi:hypothetical protein